MSNSLFFDLIRIDQKRVRKDLFELKYDGIELRKWATTRDCNECLYVERIIIFDICEFSSKKSLNM